jgi:hypothetical protein
MLLLVHVGAFEGQGLRAVVLEVADAVVEEHHEEGAAVHRTLAGTMARYQCVSRVACMRICANSWGEVGRM